MLPSYSKIAWRTIRKHKTASLINIIGLTIGISCCLLISLYVQYEASFDAFQQKGDRIARVIMQYSFSSREEPERIAVTSTKVAPVFRRTFPEVESAVRMTKREVTLRQDQTLITEPSFMFADSTFFDLFETQFVRGNARQALNGPNKVVLTESSAQKYFGNLDPMGKILSTGSDTLSYLVTGVIKDYPTNSQFKVDFLASFSSLGVSQEKTYFEPDYTTYLLLKDARDFAPLQAKIHPFMAKEMAGSGATITYWLEPFRSIHLHSPYGGFVPTTNIAYLYMLGGVALLILMIVCFTYINLSTARSVERAKEVGIRKVVGARKKEVFWQFISESTLLCFIALGLSLVITFLCLPVLNNLMQVSISVWAVFSPFFIGFMLFIPAGVGLAAGSYPAVVLADFQPVKVLKGAFKNTSSAQRVQQSLIIFQFAISVFLLVATLIIRQQLTYIQHKNLGYNRAQLIEVPLNQTALDKINTLKQELKNNPNVVSVAQSRHSPVRIRGGYSMRSSTMPANEELTVTANPIDEDYLKTTGLQLMAGQDLTKQDLDNAEPTSGQPPVYRFILNESAARQLGWSPTEAIDKPLALDGPRPGYVKGVVKDFHYASLHETIKPLVLFPSRQGQRMIVKLSGHQVPQTLQFMETQWKQLVPNKPFDFKFLDDQYQRLYQSDQQLGKLVSLFTSLSIILACLGLFGLASFMVQQRVKEIGIRKVLGASVVQVALLITKGFFYLILAAILIAFPLAWFGAQYWLQAFAYRVAISWTSFALAAFVIVFVSFLTISFQTIRAALVNPIQSLKSD